MKLKRFEGKVQGRAGGSPQPGAALHNECLLVSGGISPEGTNYRS